MAVQNISLIKNALQQAAASDHIISALQQNFEGARDSYNQKADEHNTTLVTMCVNLDNMNSDVTGLLDRVNPLAFKASENTTDNVIHRVNLPALVTGQRASPVNTEPLVELFGQQKPVTQQPNINTAPASDEPQQSLS